MNLTSLLISASLVLVSQQSTVAALSSADVEKIIQTCNTNEKACPKGVSVKQNFLAPVVWAHIQGPEQRVGALARAAKREYKKLSPADIGEDVVAPLVEFTVSALRPQKVNDRVHNVEHVFLRKKGASREDVLRPVKEVPVEETLRNGLGATTTVRDLAAFFRQGDIPNGDFEIVVVAEGWREMTLSVKPKDMAQVR